MEQKKAQLLGEKTIDTQFSVGHGILVRSQSPNEEMEILGYNDKPLLFFNWPKDSHYFLEKVSEWDPRIQLAIDPSYIDPTYHGAYVLLFHGDNSLSVYNVRKSTFKQYPFSK